MNPDDNAPQGTNAPLPGITPTVIPTSGSGEVVAERFLDREVTVARRNLRATQIIGSLATLAALGYMGYMNYALSRTFEPHAAAEIARGLVQERVELQANEVAAQIKERVPKMVADVPDYALKQMPLYREQLETQVEGDLKQYLTQNTPQLEGYMDDLLTAHKDEIKQILTDSKDPNVVKALGDVMEQEMMKKLAETQVNGESLQGKIGQSLDALQKMESKMHRLATAKDLTPQEKKARRAIAILTHTVEQKRTEAAAL